MRAAIIVGVGLGLLIWWYLANRRHVVRRERQTADWQDDTLRPDLWTSSAACVHCGASGGLLEVADDRVEFECLACGRRHVRETRA